MFTYTQNTAVRIMGFLPILNYNYNADFEQFKAGLQVDIFTYTCMHIYICMCENTNNIVVLSESDWPRYEYMCTRTHLHSRMCTRF
jgi:hypothetical protein